MGEVAWVALARVADLLTLAATVVAAWGIWTAWASRPRMKVHIVPDPLTVSVTHADGTTPARNLLWRDVTLRPDGTPLGGDGYMAWADELGSRRSLLLVFYDPEIHSFGTPREWETRQKLPAGHGIVAGFAWASPIFPWLLTQRVVLWHPDPRFGLTVPQILHGRRADRLFLAAFWGDKRPAKWSTELARFKPAN